MNRKELSVIIVAYKSEDVIGDCLSSIQQFNDLGDELEIIVVDNSPDRNTINWVCRNYPWIKIIHNPKNCGYGQGNNVGAVESTGRYLLFLNPDTIFIQPVFRYVLEKFDRDKTVGIMSLQLVSTEGKHLTSFTVNPEKKNYLHPIMLLPIVKYFNFTPQIICPMGADIFIRRDLFFKAGGFDENIFLFHEEPDLMKRIKPFKVKIINKKIVHLEANYLENQGPRYEEYFKSEKYYFKKYNLNYIRFIKQRLIYLKLKKIFLFLMGRKQSFADKLILEYYKKFLDN